MKRKCFFLILFVPFCNLLVAQELNFNVSVVTQASLKSLNSDPAIFKDLEKNLTEFLNTTKWGEDDFQQHEKIRGSLQLGLQSIRVLSCASNSCYSSSTSSIADVNNNNLHDCNDHSALLVSSTLLLRKSTHLEHWRASRSSLINTIHSKSQYLLPEPSSNSNTRPPSYLSLERERATCHCNTFVLSLDTPTEEVLFSAANVSCIQLPQSREY